MRGRILIFEMHRVFEPKRGDISERTTLLLIRRFAPPSPHGEGVGRCDYCKKRYSHPMSMGREHLPRGATQVQRGLPLPYLPLLSGRLPAISARCALYARSADVLRARCRRELSAAAPLSDRRSAVLLPRHSDDELLAKSAVLAVDHTPVEVAALQP